MFQMVITDLDGTLLNPEQKVDPKDLECLYKLGELGITRVIATGRSPFSFFKVIPPDFPIDFLVFSSGSGSMEWSSKKLLQTLTIKKEKVHELAQMFREENVAFKILDPAPDNHRYYYYKNGHQIPDFEERMEFYRGHEQEIRFDPPNYSSASQFLVILDENLAEFNRLAALCKGVKVIRATSPLDHRSIWMELFHPAVSKGNACSFICEQLHIRQDQTMAVGNDYNDLDLLRFSGRSFVVENAPQDLKDQFEVVASNRNQGFSEAVQRCGLL